MYNYTEINADAAIVQYSSKFDVRQYEANIDYLVGNVEITLLSHGFYGSETDGRVRIWIACSL